MKGCMVFQEFPRVKNIKSQEFPRGQKPKPVTFKINSEWNQKA
jgi:hypothetical protein